MMYITGDTHGGLNMSKISNKTLKKQGIKLTADDYLVVLGDFGFPFLDSDAKQRSGEYKYWMKWFSQKPYTVLWVDGNHENFNFWDKQKVSDWNGGKVQIHPEASNVIRLMRGEVYEIEGKKYFTFGGAVSHDKAYRVLNKTWWKQEEANDVEINNAKKNLEKYDYKIDVVLSHTPPIHIIRQLLNFNIIPDKTAEFLTAVAYSICYKAWFCGHLHIDINIESERLAVFYDRVESVDNFL